MKKYNYKLVLGFILGVILFGGGVYASILYSANIVYYDSTSSSLNSTNVQGAIDELATKYANLTCPSDKVCYPKKTTLSLGDYVSYTPSKTSYTTDTSKTGYTSTQTINPSELNLWRVISLNQDGTVDLISENISSEMVRFAGLTGYINYVGYLNTLASKYETTGITVGSRYFGYNGQTQYITDTSKFTSTAPWKCNTEANGCNTVENQGGGDTLYTSDYNLVNTILGTINATDPSGTPNSYYTASRWYKYGNDTTYYWTVRIIGTNGRIMSMYSFNSMYVYSGGSFNGGTITGTLRPIVTLKSGLSYDGVGNKDYPMEIIQ